MEINEAPIPEQPKITRLIVEKHVGYYATNSERNQKFVIRELNIARNGINQGYDYYKLKDLSNTESLSIVMRDKDGEKNVKLPSEMLQRIADYIVNKDKLSGKGFDCIAFAHAANGIPYSGPESFKRSNWIMSAIPEDGLTPGDTITIGDEKPDTQSFFPTHFAIYLGDGLYLSKFGRGEGPLIVADLEEMKKGFGGDSVQKMTPSRKF